jgi:hypothetical protein
VTGRRRSERAAAAGWLWCPRSVISRLACRSCRTDAISGEGLRSAATCRRVPETDPANGRASTFPCLMGHTPCPAASGGAPAAGYRLRLDHVLRRGDWQTGIVSSAAFRRSGHLLLISHARKIGAFRSSKFHNERARKTPRGRSEKAARPCPSIQAGQGLQTSGWNPSCLSARLYRMPPLQRRRSPRTEQVATQERPPCRGAQISRSRRAEGEQPAAAPSTHSPSGCSL